MKLFGSKPKKQRDHAAGGDYTEAEKAEGRKLAAQKEKKIRNRKIVLLSALLVVVAITAIVAAWYLTNVKPPDVLSDPPTISSNDPSDGDDPLSSTSSPASTKNSDRKDGVYTFVVLGMDDGNGNTDTMMVGSIDTVNSTIDIVSLPRDTMVNTGRSVRKINAAYAYGGIDGLKSELRSILGFTPDSYVIVDIEAFKVIVDTIGGVNFDVPYNMDYDDPYQNLHIHISKGYHKLYGEEALQVVRWRQNNSGTSVGDVGRIQIQQDFLKALASQCLSIGNLTKVKEFVNIFYEYVETDLSIGNLIWYGQQFLNIDSEDINFHTVPANTNDYYNGLSYVTIYVDEWLDLINEILNPYKDDITVDDVDILTRNSSGNYYATSGVIQGSFNAYISNSSGNASSSGSGNSSSNGTSSSGNSGTSSGSSGNSGSSGASGDSPAGGGGAEVSQSPDISTEDGSNPENGNGDSAPTDDASTGDGSENGGEKPISEDPETDSNIFDESVPIDSDYITLPENEQSIIID